MTTFAIATDNNITAFTAAEQVPEGQDRFATEKEYAKLSSDWPIARFAAVWNAFAGVVPFGELKPVKKFTDRKTAVARIWKAIQTLTPAPAQYTAPVESKKAKAAKDALPTPHADSPTSIPDGALPSEMRHTEAAVVVETPESAPTAPASAPAESNAATANMPVTDGATPRTAREGSKKAIVLELIRRADGASLKEIMSATDWQAHSVRGFISGSLTKKMGLTIESFKRTDGERAYRTA